jgi:tetratricopeptide (TPR) repeat protein
VRRTLGDRLGLASALSYLGQVAREQADYAPARAWLEESLALSRDSGGWELERRDTGPPRDNRQAQGDYGLARSRYEESLALARQVDNRVEQAWSLRNLGCLALDQGDYAAGRSWFAQSLALRGEHDAIGFVHALAEFASLAAAEGLPVCALRLAGAAAALTQTTSILVQHTERGRYERWLATARHAVGEDVAAATWADGAGDAAGPGDRVCAGAM